MTCHKLIPNRARMPISINITAINLIIAFPANKMIIPRTIKPIGDKCQSVLLICDIACCVSQLVIVLVISSNIYFTFATKLALINCDYY